MIGNLIEQGTMDPNHTIISIGGDGMQWPDHHVFLINNTIVNADTNGPFVNATAPIDLDIHLVDPPREDAHLHLDVRFLVVAPPGATPWPGFNPQVRRVRTGPIPCPMRCVRPRRKRSPC